MNGVPGQVVVLGVADGGGLVVDGGLIIVSGPVGPQGPIGPQGPPGQSLLILADGGSIALDGGVVVVAGPAGLQGPPGQQGTPGSSLFVFSDGGSVAIDGGVVVVAGPAGPPGIPSPGGVMVFDADGGSLGPAYALAGGFGLAPASPLRVLLGVPRPDGGSPALVWRNADTGQVTAESRCHLAFPGGVYYSGSGCTGQLAIAPNILPLGFACVVDLPPAPSAQARLVAARQDAVVVAGTVASFWRTTGPGTGSCTNNTPFPYDVSLLDDLGPPTTVAAPLRFVPR